jgi:uncharacterized protein affecting Mg2+/Co2+ transport
MYLTERVHDKQNKMFYFAYNSEIHATSFKYIQYKHAYAEMQRLQDALSSTRGWKVLSNQPQLTPEQCCPWIKNKTAVPESSNDVDDIYG